MLIGQTYTHCTPVWLLCQTPMVLAGIVHLVSCDWMWKSPVKKSPVYTACSRGLVEHTSSCIVAPLEGLEPPTNCLEGSCSVHLSYRGKLHNI
jgi:hypothetical protein